MVEVLIGTYRYWKLRVLGGARKYLHVLTNDDEAFPGSRTIYIRGGYTKRLQQGLFLRSIHPPLDGSEVPVLYFKEEITDYPLCPLAALTL